MQEHLLTQDDAGHRVDATVGQTVSVALPEKPSTGFRWAIDRMDTSVVALETAEFSAGAEAGMGSPGLRTFRFKLIAPGETELILKEWREWEGEQSVENRFVVRLHATA